MGQTSSKEADTHSEATTATVTIESTKLRQMNIECYDHLDDLESNVKSLDASLQLQQNVVAKILKENQKRTTSVEAEAYAGELSDQRPKYDEDPASSVGTDLDKVLDGNADSKGKEDKVIEDLLGKCLDDSRLSILYQARHLVDSVEVLKGFVEANLGKRYEKPKHADIQPIQGSGRNKKENDRCIPRHQNADSGQENSNTIVSLEKQLADMKHNLDKQFDTIESLNAQSVSCRSDINSLIEENTKLTRSNENKKRKIEELESKYKSLYDKHNKKQYTYSRTSWMPASRKTAFAQLFCPRRGELTSSVSAEVTTMLQSRFSYNTTDLSLQFCESASQLSPDKPGIVLCINASRLGTDVSNALQGVKLSSKLAVVILHHKDIHALPNQRSERVLTSPEYKNLGGIFDMAFLSGKGIYPCEMNNTAVENIVTFIGQHN